MAKWRVIYNFTFGNVADRDLCSLASKSTLADASMFDGGIDISSTLLDGTAALSFDGRFNIEADSKKFQSLMSELLLEPNLPAQGILPMGEFYTEDTLFKGNISIHNCPHEQAQSTWYDCGSGTASYSVTVK